MLLPARSVDEAVDAPGATNGHALCLSNGIDLAVDKSSEGRISATADEFALFINRLATSPPCPVCWLASAHSRHYQ
jgi:hypothetical protein